MARPVLTVVAPSAPACGHLDSVTRERIIGWAAGPDASEPASLQVLDNGRPVAEIVANIYRPDLEAAGLDNGRHGFDILIPGGLSPLHRHVIQVRRVQDGAELIGSPCVIEAADSFDIAVEQAITRAVEAVHNETDRNRLLHFLAKQADTLLQQHADNHGNRGARATYQRLARRWGPTADTLQPPSRRALVIDDRVPVQGRDAGSQAILSHVRALQAIGYQVSLVAADELAASENAALAGLGICLCGAPYYASVEEVLSRQRQCFDVVYLHRANMAARYLNLAREYQPGARILYSVADLHHVRLERQAAVEQRPELLSTSRALRLVECTAAWSADAVLTHSADEATILRHAVPEAQVHLVPWSIAVRSAVPASAGRNGIAFIGNGAHAPNLDAARWLLDDVLPLVWQADPAIHCLLVGGGLPDYLQRRADHRIRISGHVADLQAGVLDQVRLTVAPLRFGAGVKGKVLESFAAGVPCVMTPIAAEGLNLPADLRSLVAADARGVASLIHSLHQDEAALNALALSALRFVQSHWNDATVIAALRAAIEGGTPALLTCPNAAPSRPAAVPRPASRPAPPGASGPAARGATRRR
jgi:glycosyltransferase involved in cell wall biosynthesis